MSKFSKKHFDNNVQYNIKIITNLLANIHNERSNLLTKMYDLQKDNATLERLLQMQLMRLMTIQEFSHTMTESEFLKMTEDHQTNHTNNKSANDAYQ